MLGPYFESQVSQILTEHRKRQRIAERKATYKTAAETLGCASIAIPCLLYSLALPFPQLTAELMLTIQDHLGIDEPLLEELAHIIESILDQFG